MGTTYVNGVEGCMYKDTALLPLVPLDGFLLFSRSVVPNTFTTPQTIARQAPLSMGFPRQEYWSALPFTPSGDLPDPGIEFS